MYINPGELNKRIEIYKLEPGRDAEGNAVTERKLVRRCAARLSDTSGTELRKAGSEFSEAKRRFLVRWTPTEINTDMVVSYAGKDYGIVYVNPYGDSREYLEIWTDLAERK